jgi:Family of unknown function (DUF5683)
MFMILFIMLLPLVVHAEEPADSSNTIRQVVEQPDSELLNVSGTTELDSVSINTTSVGYMMRKNPTSAMVRSFVLPGLGQLYTGNYFKAVAFMGTDIGMIYGIFVQNDKYEEFHKKYELAKKVDDQKEYLRSANFYKDDRNRLIWWTVGLTIIAGVDAYVEAHLYGFHINPTLQPMPENDGFKAGISFTF